MTKYPCIKGFQPSSLIEWEGHLSAVVYLAGCNFRCPFCQNPDLTGSAEQVESIPFDEIMESIRLQDGWLDGVCITGGEPTCETSLFEMIKEFKKCGLSVHLETNGSRPEILKVLVGSNMIDYVAMDFKAPLNEKYAEATGGMDNLEAVGESMDFLLTGLIDYEFRTTVVPGLLDENDLVEMAKTVPHARRFFIQRFSTERTLDPSYSEREPYTDEKLQQFARSMRMFCPVVRLRGKPEDKNIDDVRSQTSGSPGVKRF